MEQAIKILFLGGDEQDYARAQELLASRSRFELQRAASLPEGTAMLSLDKFDLILLSLNPTEGGLGIGDVQALHTNVPNVPVIALGDSDDENMAVEAMRGGAEDYLVKAQVNSQLLRRSIRYAMERHRAEEKLVASEAFYHSLVENLPQNILRKDLQERFTFANQKFCSILGKSLSEVIGKTDFDFFPPQLAEKYQRDDQFVMRTGRAFETVEENIAPGGEKRYVNVVKTPIYDAKGKIIGIQGIFWDITERKQWEERLQKANEDLARSEAALRKSHEDLKAAQAQLIQAEKMESIGTLAAGVAHEVKNPLAILMMGVNYLSKKLSKDENLLAILKDMREAINRADTIARGLLEFSASRQLAVKSHDLNDIIDETLRLLRTTLTQKNIELEKQFQPAMPPVRVDKNQLQQVFVNLFMNAVHAMGSGGTITVRTYTKQYSDTTFFEGSRQADRFWVGDNVVVAEVDDSGTGIPEEHLTKIFDPFFTTKPTGVGTGLGLPVSKRIIELHGGTLELKNLPGRGVRARVMLKGQRGDYGQKTHTTSR
jgi:PAS domain S-box-containing protein